ncbi:MAG: hypothetical protein V1720_13660 [bacterium]
MNNEFKAVIKNTAIIIFFISLLIGFPLLAQSSSIQNNLNEKSISINQFKITFSSNTISTISSIKENYFDSRLLWPGGLNSFKPLADFDSFFLGGIVENDTITLGKFLYAGIDFDVQPGKILDDGNADDPSNERYRIYKIQKNWETLPYNEERDQLEKDYNEWPIEDGALWEDVDGDGLFSRGIDKPKFIGDEVLYYVVNDMNNEKYFGLEIQITIYAFKGSGDLGNIVFRNYKLINKSSHHLKEMFTGFWSDPNLGRYSNNIYSPVKLALGCDSLLNMGFAYCFSDENKIYSSSPAIGYIYLNSTDSQQKNYLDAFNLFIHYCPGDKEKPYYFYLPNSTFEMHNTMSGLMPGGNQKIDPTNGKPTKYAVPGDPVKKLGWYDWDGWNYADSTWYNNDPCGLWNPLTIRSMLISSGPFTMAPGDTQEVVIATIAAQGKDNFDSVTQLKRRAKVIQKAYYSNFQLTTPPPLPTVHFLPEDQSVTLWWDDKAEIYDEQDPYIFELGFADTTYTFEGYIMRQYSDSTGSDPRIIKMFDKTNGISVIGDYELVNGTAVKVPVLFGNDDGIVHYYKIDTDDFSNGPLLSGSEYFFSVNSYAFSLNSSPTFIESPAKIFRVIPGKEKIDYTTPYSSEGKLLFQPDGEIIDSKIEIMVVDPSAITGDEYKLSFRLEESDVLQPLRYTLSNSTTSDTLIYDSDLITTDTLNKPIIDGFMILIDNSIQDSVVRHGIDKKHSIKDFVEVSSGKSVMDIYNSTNKWKIKKRTGVQDMRRDINWQGNVTYDSYELRFTPTGSEYYSTGYIQQSGIFQDDPKGKGTVPFEAWRIGKDGEERLMIKVWDKENKDSVWTHNETTNEWERLYIYESVIPYSEPIPLTSGLSETTQHILGNLIIEGEMPEAGTVIRITTFRPIIEGDEVTIRLEKANTNNTTIATERKDEISAFPNPYFAGNNTTGQDYVRFTGLPVKATIRIYSLAGVFIRKYEKEEMSQYIDWDLRNEYGEMVASGIYIAYIEMPGIGNKILKVAVVAAKEYLNNY